jgi:hypothetical protein
VGALSVTAILSGAFALNPVAANAAAIVVCSIINFLASEALVFKTIKTSTTAAMAVLSFGVPLGAASSADANVGLAELTAATIAANAIRAPADDDTDVRCGDAFFVLDVSGCTYLVEASSGQIPMVRGLIRARRETVGPDGRIHTDRRRSFPTSRWTTCCGISQLGWRESDCSTTC